MMVLGVMAAEVVVGVGGGAMAVLQCSAEAKKKEQRLYHVEFTEHEDPCLSI